MPLLVLLLLVAAPTARAGELALLSDLNAALAVTRLDDAAGLGLEPGPRLGGRLRYDCVAFQGFPLAFSSDLALYGPTDLWEHSLGLGLGYWLGPVGFGLLGGAGLQGGGRKPLASPAFFTLNLQATAAMNLGDMLRLRVWARPIWLATVLQGREGSRPAEHFANFQPLLTLAGHSSDELALGMALALTLPRHGPANHLYNGSATFWVGAESRSMLRNRMVSVFIGYGAATGAYNGSPL
ncbi:hypothetical protein [Archangium violaceum]|uniref:Uncharacterized protein n=1 Tax=Archangium violaceum Cb vi76 TaxID=1406225 RepID=A0A084SZX2_9BACT|nr:hypothetical protein [Archangium violaceum]KFA94007.1 hypothetical protein Q664_05445 [Archangium violaceum Cb vi76]